MAWQIFRGVSIETNILKLLPKPEQDVAIEEAVNSLSQSLASNMLFLVAAKDESLALNEADRFSKSLNESGLFGEIKSETTKELETEWFNYYFPKRYKLLSPSFRTDLLSQNPQLAIKKRVLKQLYSPAPDFYGEALSFDPLMLFPDFVQSSIASSQQGEMVEGKPLFLQNDSTYVLVSAPLNGDAFAPTFQEKVEQFVLQEKITTGENNSELLALGIVRFARAGFKQGKQEASYIGAVSMVAVLLILLLVFRSFRAIIIGVVPLLVGLIYALATTFIFYNKVHLISLTMGACLSGVAIDYSFHYLSDYIFNRREWESAEGLKRIFAGISIGAVTTVIGYVAFILTPLPGLKQIALFTTAGLLGSYLTVVLAFPTLLKNRSSATLPSSISYGIKSISNLLEKLFSSKTSLLILLIIFLVCSLFLIKKISFNDDIYQLKASTPVLDREEQRVNSVVSDIEASRFIVVSAESEELLLQKLEDVELELINLKDSGVISNFSSISKFVSSKKRATENRGLLLSLFEDNSPLIESLLNLGFDSLTLSNVEGDIINLNENSDIDSWLNSSVSSLFSSLWVGKVGSQFVSVVLLSGVDNEPAIKSHFANDKSVNYINRIEEISSVLTRYRNQAMKVVLFAYLTIWLLLTIRYGFIGSLRVMIAPLLGGAVALFTATTFGGSLNLMHILALLLVLGVGIDYTIFFAEGSSRQEETLLAVTLSAITTILSFGVLVLSTTPALGAIGQIIIPGILVSLLVSPVASGVRVN